MANAAESKSLSKGLITVQVAYLLVLSIFSIYWRVFPGPEYMFVACLLVVIWRSDTRRFLVSLTPFILLLLSYEVLRGYARIFARGQVHVFEMIDWDQAVFGGVVPAAWAQAVLRGTRWMYPVIAVSNFVYLSHFVVPIVVALMIWQRAPQYYWRYVIGLLALSYAGFTTYLLYPAAPPWLASWGGALPGQPVQNLTHFWVISYAMNLNPNPIAAMPSLHAAYPVYISACCMWVWGKRAVATALVPVGVCLASIILGQHYVIDLLAGMVYALVAFLLVRWAPWRKPSEQLVAALQPAVGTAVNNVSLPIETA